MEDDCEIGSHLQYAKKKLPYQTTWQRMTAATGPPYATPPVQILQTSSFLEFRFTRFVQITALL